MIDWFKKHRVLFALICVVILLLLMGIPFVINILFKINTTTDIFVAEWSAGDALGYYGAILSFLGTVVLGALALYQNHIIKTEADKKAALAEEQERAENMPRFFLRFQCASGFCGSLKFAVMNVSNNIAYTVDVYDIKIKGGSKTIWESDDIVKGLANNFMSICNGIFVNDLSLICQGVQFIILVPAQAVIQPDLHGSSFPLWRVPIAAHTIAHCFSNS